MTFKQLKVGDSFKFVKQISAGGGIFNGVGTKTSRNTYRMASPKHTIGNPQLEVVIVKE